MNLRPLLSDIYPEGAYGGQCGVFAHQLVDFPSVGDTYYSKKKAVDQYGIRASQLAGDIRIGDVLICSDGTFMGIGAGHVAVVNNKIGSTLYLSESNFKNDLKVHHGRTLDANSSKIYGVIRRPFKFKLPDSIVLNVTCLMNYDVQWKNGAFQLLEDWFDKTTNGRIKLNVIPLYTFNALKDWWYRIERSSFGGGEYKVIDRGYVLEQVMPLRYPNTHFVLWAVKNSQWQGSAFNSGQQLTEYGWEYINTNPGVATIACDENDRSFKYPKELAFVHYARHEICHFLENYGNRRNLMMTDIFDGQETLEKVFNNIELDYLQVNI